MEAAPPPPTIADREAAQRAAAAARQQEAYVAQLKSRADADLERLISKWDYANPNSRIPTATWPKVQPTEEDIPGLDIMLRRCTLDVATPTKDARWLSACGDLQYMLGTALLALPDPEMQRSGATLYGELAALDHVDASCGFAICLNDGRGVEEDSLASAALLDKHAYGAARHPQSQYELGVLLYNGVGVPENEEKAVALFKLAAAQGHTGAMYMLGDSMLEGIGCAKNQVAALDWLFQAGEQGHRGARSRYLALLNGRGTCTEDGFTDDSRQTPLLRRRTTRVASQG